MFEEWRIIPSYPAYEASNLGYVRNAKTKKVLYGTPRRDGSGRQYCLTVYSDGFVESSQCLVMGHYLVYEAFHPSYNRGDPYLCVFHLDGNSENNKIENLIAGTNAERWANIKARRRAF